MRQTRSGIVATHGGCFDCGAEWGARNTLAVAARHHDATGHATWVEQILRVDYGQQRGGGGQLSLFPGAGE